MQLSFVILIAKNGKFGQTAKQRVMKVAELDFPGMKDASAF